MAQAYVSFQAGNWDLDSTWADAWVADTVQTVGSWRRPTVANGYIYECTARAGDYKTHASTEPTWPTTIGTTVVDDQVTWTCRDKYPNQTTAGQTFTVTAAQTLNYNVSSTVALGASTINGLLSFVTSASTKLTMGGVNLTVANGGELRIGTTAGGAFIPKAYTAELLWDMGTTADNTVGLVIAAGGNFTVAGDPDYYGGDGTQAFMRAVTVSYSGTTLIVEGDYSGWNDNDSIVVYRNHTYSSWLTDVVPLTINGAPSYSVITGNTTITVDQTAAGTWNAGGYAWNLTRNVRVGKLIADAEPWPINNSGTLKAFTYRPNITHSSNITVSSVCFQGVYSVDGNLAYGVKGTDVVMRHCHRMYRQLYLNVTSGVWAASYYPFYYLLKSNAGADFISSGTGGIALSEFSTISGMIVSPYFIQLGHNNSIFSGLHAGNANGFYAAAGSFKITGDMRNCKYIVNSGGNSVVRIEGSNLEGTTYLFCFTYGHDCVMTDCLFPVSPTYFGRNTGTNSGRYYIVNYDQVISDDRVYDCFGTIYRKTADGTGSEPEARTTANDQVLKIQTETNCSALNPLLIINPDKHRVYCAAGVTKKWRYYCQTDKATEIVDGDRLAATPVNGITLEASWLDGTTNSSRTVTISTQHIQPRTATTDWSQYLEVECTPAVDGYVYLSVYLMEDIGSTPKYLWVDPFVEEIAAVPLKYAVIWADGESQLAQMDQSAAWLIADAVWDEATADHTTTGTFGKKVGDLVTINGIVYERVS